MAKSTHLYFSHLITNAEQNNPGLVNDLIQYIIENFPNEHEASKAFLPSNKLLLDNTKKQTKKRSPNTQASNFIFNTLTDNNSENKTSSTTDPNSMHNIASNSSINEIINNQKLASNAASSVVASSLSQINSNNNQTNPPNQSNSTEINQTEMMNSIMELNYEPSTLPPEEDLKYVNTNTIKSLFSMKTTDKVYLNFYLSLTLDQLRILDTMYILWKRDYLDNGTLVKDSNQKVSRTL